jgi:hypothetical protein
LGPWLLIAGLGVALLGAKGWLDTAMAETADARRGAPAHDAGMTETTRRP